MLSFQTRMNNVFYFVNGLSPKKSSYDQCKRVIRSVTSYRSCSPDCCLCYVVAFARGLQWECFKQLSMKGLDFAEKVGDMPKFKGSYKIQWKFATEWKNQPMMIQRNSGREIYIILDKNRSLNTPKQLCKTRQSSLWEIHLINE